MLNERELKCGCIETDLYSNSPELGRAAWHLSGVCDAHDGMPCPGGPACCPDDYDENGDCSQAGWDLLKDFTTQNGERDWTGVEETQEENSGDDN